MNRNKINIFWFRRDLRLHDNAGLYQALKAGNVLPVFIFDSLILEDLNNRKDARVTFLHRTISDLKRELEEHGASLLVEIGEPTQLIDKISNNYDVGGVYVNSDYEPYARQRDKKVKDLLQKKDIGFYSFKDQVIFEKSEVLKDDGEPYVVFTPYKNKWLDKLSEKDLKTFNSDDFRKAYHTTKSFKMPGLKEIGFEKNDIEFPSKEPDIKLLRDYDKLRDFPFENASSRLGMHFRFGTVSIRQWTAKAKRINETFLGELIWREFFMMILWHHPRTLDQSFKKKYDNIQWRNDENEFKSWCDGKTGYPMVDAGMRQLNQSGFMHNRLRMVTGSFLVKHLLIDWRWGEAYFAEKLLDYELSSNVGNWQWVAGSGCDAAPYFRIFNPQSQMKKYDPEEKFIQQWIPEYGSPDYPEPVVEHKSARERALKAYKKAVK